MTIARILKQSDIDFFMYYLIYNKKTGKFKLNKNSYIKHKIGKEIGEINWSGYLIIRLYRKRIMAHRLAYAYVYGVKNMPEQIDHKNCNKSDNRICNLRPSNKYTNTQNVGLTKSNSSGCKGICWAKTHKMWKAYLYNYNVCFHVGYFKNIKEAKKAIRKKRTEIHGEFANHG